MSKKDFETVAEAIYQIDSAADRWLVANMLADKFAVRYERFKRDVFMKACGFWGNIILGNE